MSYLKRKTIRYKPTNIGAFRQKVFTWVQKFETFSILENNNIPYPFESFQNIVAAGVSKELSLVSKDTFEELKQFIDLEKDWVFGYFSYDLKNQTEALSSENTDFQCATEECFFIPLHLLIFKDDDVEIYSHASLDQVINEIENCTGQGETEHYQLIPKPSVSKEFYIRTVNEIKNRILEGDVYELNYCVEFTASDVEIDPLSLFSKLIKRSPMPFSAFFKNRSQYIICASPERFLKKSGAQLVSQPIKGTIRRGSSSEEDEQLKEQLRTLEKERAENIMIVDLVRNDLARSSKPGSVEVYELCGIYTFKQLHQMVSTVISEIGDGIHPVDSIKNAFPMGSMTGAPKIKAMQLIEEFETSKRGLFSGALGYFAPDLSFDFNVLIRSIFYNSALGRLSFQVGSAITYDADPESEYEECLLKAAAIFQVLAADKG